MLKHNAVADGRLVDGGAWVLYFADAPTLAKDLATGHAPLIAYLWIGALTATTYVLAGHMREQVCIICAPWPRIQAALTDEYALNVTYRYDRGELRRSVKKGEQLRLAGWRPAIASIASNANVCPTSIGIRNGAQLEMPPMRAVHRCLRFIVPVGWPPRLIAYDSGVNLKLRLAGKPQVQKSYGLAQLCMRSSYCRGWRHHAFMRWWRGMRASMSALFMTTIGLCPARRRRHSTCNGCDVDLMFRQIETRRFAHLHWRCAGKRRGDCRPSAGRCPHRRGRDRIIITRNFACSSISYVVRSTLLGTHRSFSCGCQIRNTWARARSFP